MQSIFWKCSLIRDTILFGTRHFMSNILNFDKLYNKSLYQNQTKFYPGTNVKSDLVNLSMARTLKCEFSVCFVRYVSDVVKFYWFYFETVVSEISLFNWHKKGWPIYIPNIIYVIQFINAMIFCVNSDKMPRKRHPIETWSLTTKNHAPSVAILIT